MKNALHFIFGLALTIPMAQAQFSFTDLGSLPGSGPTPAVIAYGMNSVGDVCGSSSFIAPITHIDPIHAFLWKPAKANGTIGGMIDLGVVPHPSGENWSICTAVSTFAPVGYGYYPPEMSYRALVFGGEKFPLTTIPLVLPIPEPPPDFTPNSYAHAVNDSGVVAGSWTASAGIYHALLWKPEGASFTVTDLNSPGFPGWELNVATGVNSAGHVIGFGTFAGAVHGFLLTPSGLTDLGSLSPGFFTQHTVPTGINSKDQVVGYSMTPSGFHHAFLWSKGVITDLGVPSIPGMPTLPGIMTPLGLLKPPTLASSVSPFTNSVATAINDNGKIVGWANMNPHGSTAYEKTAYGWGTAVAYDINPGATPPGLATGWNILSMPSVTAGAPSVPPGLPMGGPPPVSAMLAAFAINNSDQIAGLFIKPGPLDSAFLLTSALPLKP